MIGLSALWLPILLSAGFVFIASSVIHMLLPWHKGDFKRLPQEDQITTVLRPLAIPPGDYMLPKPDSTRQLRTPEYADRLANGPVLMMTVMPNGLTRMGGMLARWFVYLLVVALLAAAITVPVLPAGADRHVVFHTIAVASFLGYGMALWQMSIWYHRSLGTTVRSTVDSLVYALITAATFAWLWPR